MKDNGNFNRETSKQSAHDTYITVQTLKNMFKTVKEEYQKKFIEMYGFDSTDCYWIENVLYVADYYFDFYDIKFAVDNSVHEKELFSWYDYNLTIGEYCLGDISLESYIKGVRPYKDDDINELRKLQSEFNKAKSSLDDLLYKLKNGNTDN